MSKAAKALYLASIVVTMNPMTKVGKNVYPWEVDVLRAKHGDSNVQFVGTGPVVEPEYEIRPSDEFERLAKAYGKLDDVDELCVVRAFGAGVPGVRALAGEIKAAFAGADPAEREKERSAALEGIDLDEEEKDEETDGGKPPADPLG